MGIGLWGQVNEDVESDSNESLRCEEPGVKRIVALKYFNIHGSQSVVGNSQKHMLVCVSNQGKRARKGQG